MFFEAFSAAPLYLSPGDYQADSTGRAFTFGASYLSRLFRGDTLNFEALPEGQFEVILDEDIYTILGSGKVGLGEDFSFSYQGIIPIYRK